MTEWDIGSWSQQPTVPVGQHYKVAMSVHCHKSVSVRVCCEDIKLQQTETLWFCTGTVVIPDVWMHAVHAVLIQLDKLLITTSLFHPHLTCVFGVNTFSAVCMSFSFSFQPSHSFCKKDVWYSKLFLHLILCSHYIHTVFTQCPHNVQTMFPLSPQRLSFSLFNPILFYCLTASMLY